MKKLAKISAIIAVTVIIGQGTALAKEMQFNKQMALIVDEYLKIPAALAADKTEGVSEAARKIHSIALKMDPSGLNDENYEHLKMLPEKIGNAASVLAGKKDINEMRTALVELSKPLITWTKISKPKGIYLASCSMFPGDWLQTSSTISNPYYGSKMLRCGTISTESQSNPTQSEKTIGHQGHSH